MARYEVEIKSLLGDAERARALQEKMRMLDPETALTSKNTQLNHYFEGGAIAVLLENAINLFSNDAQERLVRMVEKGADFSVRTRQKDAEVFLVVKASVDGGTSSNTVSRLEFEEPVSCALAELDELLLSAGFRYQAKWSREREEYICKGFNVCLDRNAGYGYVAEFEKIVEDERALVDARLEIERFMEEVGAIELPQERLARMFAHYNQNWAEYYGTEKIFVII